MLNLITIGDAVVDTHVQIDSTAKECKLRDKPYQLCLDYATKIPITNSFQSLGGNACNVAVAAKKLGLKTAILTTLGDDSNGKLILDELNKFKINTDLVNTELKKQTRYSIVLNFKGERTILSYHSKRKYIWPNGLNIRTKTRFGLIRVRRYGKTLTENAKPLSTKKVSQIFHMSIFFVRLMASRP